MVINFSGDQLLLLETGLGWQSHTPSSSLSSQNSKFKNWWTVIVDLLELNIRASHHEATFSKSLAWVFFWCLFMFRNDLKILKNLGRSFHDWKMVLKITNPHYRVKIQNCRRPMVWPIKTCARRALSQRKKLELNPTYQLREKSKKPPERTSFLETGSFGWFFRFFP